MKSSKSYSIHPKHLRNAKALRRSQTADSAPRSEPPPAASTVRTTPRDFANPVDYQHPYESMGRFAQTLALRYDANRTRHSYYRQLRLLHEHFALDPALLTETHLRDYFLFVKLQKHWKPKSIRQTLAATRLFFVDLLGHTDWKVFGQIRTKDHDVLPPVLSRREVHTLLAHIRLRRYRTPVKLIYACGLRLTKRGQDMYLPTDVPSLLTLSMPPALWRFHPQRFHHPNRCRPSESWSRSGPPEDETTNGGVRTGN